MSHPVLPRLLSNHRITDLKPGVWNRLPQDQIRAVARGLEVPDREFRIHSIPDVWARVLQFDGALYADGASEISKSARSEWRGLLAVLGLRKLRNLATVDFAPILPRERTLFHDVVELLSPDTMIDRTKALHNRVARDKLEGATIHEDTTWTSTYLIRLGDSVIGVTSPTTLVCTASSMPPGALAAIPWFRNGKLGDPRDDLHKDERTAIAIWLKRIHLDLMQIASGAKWTKLSALLQSYVADLGGAPADDKRFDLRPDSKEVGGIFFTLGHALNYASSGQLESEVELQSSRPGAASRRKVLVVDPDTARQWRRNFTGITVLGTVPLSAALAGLNPAQRDAICGLPIPNGEWVNASEFFTDKLFIFERAERFPGAEGVPGSAQLRWEDEPVTAILPIRKRWLTEFTAVDLAKRITLSSAANRITITFRIPLRTGELEVVKDYLKEQIEELPSRPPIVKLWPFLTYPGWKAYYSYYDNVGEPNIVVRPHIPEEDLKPQSIPTPPTPPGAEPHVAEVTRMESYPEFLVCTYRGQECGVLFLKQPVPSVPQGKTWKVGIDFGTTGTAVYSSTAADQPGKGRPVEFARERMLSIPVEEASIENATFDRFLPSDRRRGDELLSIYHDFHADRKESTAKIELTPILDGHIYFINDVKRFEAYRAGISTNMKWGDTRARARGRAFLEQLAMHICAEAAVAGVNNISWRFSFPTAFGVNDLSEFEGIWADVVRYAEKQTGILHSDGDVFFLKKSESIATAHSFRVSDGAFLQQGAVCIDIGGGTSDIAIWQNNSTIGQASVRLAGRDLFLHPLHMRPQFLAMLGIDVKSLVAAQREHDEYVFHSQLDAFLKDPSQSQAMMNRLPLVVREPIVQGFLTILEAGISGLLHYVGLMVRHFEAEKKYTRRIPNLYIGGNASKIFHWIAGGAYTNNSPVAGKLKAVFARATDFRDCASQAFEIRLSKNPKAEVAHGLVIDVKHMESAIETNYFVDDDPRPPLLAGEEVVIDGVQSPWNTMLREGDVHRSLTVRDSLPQLQQYLKNVKLAGSDDPLLIPRCVEAVNQAFYDAKGDHHANLEPPFITALRAVLEERSRVWAESPLTAQENVHG